MPTMFHEGDLQSGISLALKEQKLVSCFVYQEDDPRSTTWETTYLPSARSLIAEETVLLRVKLGTQEAGFLSAFCPITSAPTLVVIDHGRVAGKLEGALEQEEWNEKLKMALAVRDKVHTTSEEKNRLTGDSSTGASVVPVPDTQSTATSQGSTQTSLQSLLPDRASRLEADHAARQAEEKAARTARSEARRREAAAAAATSSVPSAKAKGKQPATGPSDPRHKARTDWVNEQAKRKGEAKSERERILQQIESDRQERKNREAQRKEAFAPAEAFPTASQGDQKTASSGTHSQMCALQVRLFDGSSIKSRFTSSSSLATAVRTWIGEAAPAGAADTPYDFRVILAPNPSRTVGISEEEQSLQELGLAPSATLVLVPSTRQAGNVASSVLAGGILGPVYGVASGAASVVGFALDYVRGWTGGGPYIGGVGDETEPSNVAGARMATGDSTGTEMRAEGTARMRHKTLADQRAEADDRDRGTEFYNGNSSAFEGRKDAEDNN